MRRLLAAVLAFLMLPMLLSAQGAGVAYQSNAFTTVSINGTVVVKPVPGAQIYVCLYSAIACTNANQQPIFSDINLTQPVAQPLLADKYGNFAFYSLPGQYLYTINSATGSPLATYPFSVLSAGSGAIFPQSVNAVLYADSFPGSDICAKINAATASVAGIGSTPAPSVLVNLSPGKTYTVSTQCVVPNSTSFPFILNPTIDCNGSTITGDSGLGANPMFMLTPENALSSANWTGEIRNCTLMRDTAGPIIYNATRLGFKLTNVRLSGGTIGYYGLNLVQPTWGGYQEESLFQNVSISGCSQYGIDLEKSTGTDSFLYSNWENIKFDLDAGCAVGFHLGANASIQGGHFKFKVNVNGGSSVYVLKNDGTILSSQYDLAGENTGGASQIFPLGGSGYSSMVVVNLNRLTNACVGENPPGQSNGGAGNGNHIATLQAPCGAAGFYPSILPGEGNPNDIGSGVTQMLTNNGGGDANNTSQIIEADTDANTAIWNARNVKNRLYTDGRHSSGVGLGWWDAYGNPLVGAVTGGSTTMTLNGMYASSMHPDDQFTPTQLLVGTCTSGGSTVTPFGTSVGPLQVGYYNYNQPGFGANIAVTLTATPTASASCNFVERPRNPPFTLTVHGTYGSEATGNTSGQTKSESSGWSGSDFLHTFFLLSSAGVGQPGSHFAEQAYNGSTGTGSTNFRDCQITGNNVSGNSPGGSTCTQPGNQVFGAVNVLTLTGTGNALACIDASGNLYRGTATTCP